MRKVLLLVLLSVVGCAPYARVAARTVSVVGDAEVAAVRLAVEAHRVELVKLTDEAVRIRTAAGCPEVGECTAPAWLAAQPDLHARKEAAKARFAKLTDAAHAVDAALAELSLAAMLAEESVGEFDLQGALQRAAQAWGVLAAALRDFGVTPPALNLKGH